MSGAELRGLREARGLTQAEAAGRVGVARNTWSRWENGKRAVSELAEIAIVERVGKLRRKSG
jgi:transcriptional regulator with XRE-family HTH domain